MSVLAIKTPLRNIRARIVTVLGAVPNVGRVYGRVRNVNQQAVVQELLTDSAGKLAFWFVTLATAQPFSQTRRFPASHSIGTANFELMAYRAFNDAEATEEPFHDHVADVLEAFEADVEKKLGGLAIEAGPIQWQTAGHAQMVDALCHQGSLVLPVQFIVEC